MSVDINITITLPLESVATILAADDPKNDAGIYRLLATKTTHAVIDAVKALPDDIKKRAVDSAEEPGKLISVSIASLVSHVFPMHGLPNDIKVAAFADLISERLNIRRNGFKLLFGTKHIYGGDAVEAASMSLAEVI